jgi:hypothetical protein
MIPRLITFETGRPVERDPNFYDLARQRGCRLTSGINQISDYCRDHPSDWVEKNFCHQLTGLPLLLCHKYLNALKAVELLESRFGELTGKRCAKRAIEFRWKQ